MLEAVKCREAARLCFAEAHRLGQIAWQAEQTLEQSRERFVRAGVYPVAIGIRKRRVNAGKMRRMSELVKQHVGQMMRRDRANGDSHVAGYLHREAECARILLGAIFNVQRDMFRGKTKPA